MENMNVQFSFKEAIPKECEGKTLSEVFDMVRIKYNELIKGIKSQDDLDRLPIDDQMYIRMGMMFSNMAKGDMSSLTGVESPYNKK